VVSPLTLALITRQSGAFFFNRAASRSTQLEPFARPYPELRLSPTINKEHEPAAAQPGSNNNNNNTHTR